MDMVKEEVGIQLTSKYELVQRGAYTFESIIIASTIPQSSFLAV